MSAIVSPLPLTCSNVHSKARTRVLLSQYQTWGWWSTLKSISHRKSAHRLYSDATMENIDLWEKRSTEQMETKRQQNKHIKCYTYLPRDDSKLNPATMTLLGIYPIRSLQNKESLSRFSFTFWCKISPPKNKEKWKFWMHSRALQQTWRHSPWTQESCVLKREKATETLKSQECQKSIKCAPKTSFYCCPCCPYC